MRQRMQVFLETGKVEETDYALKTPKECSTVDILILDL